MHFFPHFHEFTDFFRFHAFMQKQINPTIYKMHLRSYFTEMTQTAPVYRRLEKQQYPAKREEGTNGMDKRNGLVGDGF